MLADALLDVFLADARLDDLPARRWITMIREFANDWISFADDELYDGRSASKRRWNPEPRPHVAHS
jgi:hypothetical protein